MTDTVLLIRTEKEIATLLLNRPEKHHAFNEEMVKAIIAQLTTLNEDKDLRLLVLRSEGKHFCAGADLAWMKKMLSYSLEENEKDASLLSTLMHKLANFSKPTLAFVQGSALGGGAGLVACTDLVIASSEANFCFSEVKIGLIPATISPYVIRTIGEKAAKRYFMTAETIDAHTALNLGLIHKIVPFNTFDKELDNYRKIFMNNGPIAVETTKKWVNEVSASLQEIDLPTKTYEMLAKIRCSKEGQEGIKAFIEKRTPNWIKN